MDFSLTDDQKSLRDLARQIIADGATHEHLQQLEKQSWSLFEYEPKEMDHHELLQQCRHITEDPTRSNSIVHRFVEPEDIGQIQARFALVARKAALLRHLGAMDRDICLLALRAARQIVLILRM